MSWKSFPLSFIYLFYVLSTSYTWYTRAKKLILKIMKLLEKAKESMKVYSINTKILKNA